ncbi:MAG: hypothetical protein MSA09_07415 [Lachnospiraceae bacterium]|nr:hypothetical protein [Lachnospiraceae bacterium]
MDKAAVEKAIKHFEFYARPSSANHSEPATVGDIKKLIEEISKLARSISNAAD